MSGPLELLGTWLRKINHDGAPVIQTTHLEIHEGEVFTRRVLSSGTADDGQIRALFWNPSGSAGKDAHAAILFHVGGLSYGYIYENPNIAATGTMVAGINYNRRKASLKPSQWKFGRNPVINSPGTELHGAFLGGTDATNPNEAVEAGETREGFEWVLDPNNVYLFVGLNQGGKAVPAEISIEWYEHLET